MSRECAEDLELLLNFEIKFLKAEKGLDGVPDFEGVVRLATGRISSATSGTG